MSKDITVIIFSYNNVKVIQDCIKSAKILSDRIILIDQESTDNTIDIATKLQIKIIKSPHYDYVEPVRSLGINQATTDWIFIMDADERITPALAQEILKQKLETQNYSHYKIPRKNIFGKKWLRHGGWWPDQQIRLINKKYLKTWPTEIHSTPVIDGSYGVLTNPLLHLFHGNLKSMVQKTAVFEDIESDLLLKAGKKVSTMTFFRKFLGELWRRLIKNFGFLDGTIGIIESIYQAFSKTITYLYLYEKRLKKSSKKGSAL